MDTVLQQSPTTGTTNGTVYLNASHSPSSGPIIAVSPDIRDGRVRVSQAVLDAIVEAGGVPMILPGDPKSALALLQLARGLVLTGGDDPRMEAFGQATHPASVLVHPARQALDLALLEASARRPDRPVLAICLGMQYLGLVCGGSLEQHLPDVLDTAATHANNAVHAVSGPLGEGEVVSHHRQALSGVGSLEVIARSPDGVIEAVRHPNRDWTLGVQWHPERMGEGPLGVGLLRTLVERAQAVSA